ncbi:peroxiredoxin [Phaeospirillum tilakii]|uniref:thioredoxin-dependent peroxiredoxin n=1 Tax=Phaeospirillum tilakii TaxID=741673 RepID=A0ABW5CD50_9PROT
MTLEPGQPAPDFTLDSENGPLRLADFAGRTLVLYFYPKDNTSGCSAEAAAFRDAYPAFRQAGIEVVGVSRDSVASHAKFRAKLDLPFPLGADSDGAVTEAYGVWVEKSMYGRKYFGIERATFLIGGDGTIRAVWRKVKVPGHVAAVLKEATR